MEPKTKMQKRASALAQKLRPLTAAERRQAEGWHTPPTLFWNHSGGWCSCCGSDVPPKFLEYWHDPGQGEIKDARCPTCGAVLQGSYSRKSHNVGSILMAKACVVEEFQVFRLFSVEWETRRGAVPSHNIWELAQTWITSEGKETIIGRGTSRYGYQIRYTPGPMEVRPRQEWGGWRIDNRYDLVPHKLFTGAKFLPLLSRNGMTAKGAIASGLPLNTLAKRLLTDNFAETLMKTSQMALLADYCLGRCRDWEPCHAAIANRHHYIVYDARDWSDHISLLRRLGMDDHNPRYLCPDNFQECHRELVERSRRIADRQRLEMRRNIAARVERAYRKAKGRFFPLRFTAGDIEITPIASVAEMRAEGDAMHHCVYQAEYYKRKDSLVLSAHTLEGERLETVEVNLSTMSVSQSRGRYNEPSKEHQRILEIMDKALPVIRAAAEARSA